MEPHSGVVFCPEESITAHVTKGQQEQGTMNGCPSAMARGWEAKQRTKKEFSWVVTGWCLHDQEYMSVRTLQAQQPRRGEGRFWSLLD